jgi:hypothetical protein
MQGKKGYRVRPVAVFYSGDLVGPIPANNTLFTTDKLLLVYKGRGEGGVNILWHIEKKG